VKEVNFPQNLANWQKKAVWSMYSLQYPQLPV